MKSIDLTTSQKSKLLEMCKKLFPNDKIDSFENNTIKFLINYCKKKDCNNDKITYAGWEEVLKIHWFEFCMTHLIIKLQNSLPDDVVWREQPQYVSNVFGWKKGSKWTLYSDFFFHYPKQINKIHPVDYLYKEFKKL